MKISDFPKVRIIDNRPILTPVQFNKANFSEFINKIYPQHEGLDEYLINICKNYENQFFTNQVTDSQISDNDRELLLNLIEVSQIEKVNKSITLVDLYGIINEYLCNHEFNHISFLLKILPFKWIEPLFVIGFLRITFPARDKIINWRSVLMNYKNYLDNNTEYDSERLLIGLLNENK
jgi:hypothetical protein